MSRPYNDNTFVQYGFEINATAPIDERFVLRYRSDLTDSNNWDEHHPLYNGIFIAVVADSIPSNNGIYMLLKQSKYRYFRDPQGGELYHPEGWIQINATNAPVILDQYTIKDGNAESLDTDVQQNGLHVVRVDGGIF